MKIKINRCQCGCNDCPECEPQIDTDADEDYALHQQEVREYNRMLDMQERQ